MYANFGTRGVIRLYNDDNLDRALWRYGARKIANECKYAYQQVMSEAINISTESLKWEIIGHYDMNILAHVGKYHPGLIARTISKIIIKRTDVFDMGEAHVDSNRMYWDILAANRDELIKSIEERYKVIVLE